MELYDDAEVHTKFATYVSRVIPLPARYAPTVFERWWLDGRRGARAVPARSLRLDGGRLELDAVTWARPYPISALTPYRQVRGRLQGNTAWPLRIELELVPWSASHSAIAVRYTGRRMPGRRGVDRYHELAVEALDRLQVEIEQLGHVYVSHVAQRELDTAA